jgi:hypothetical protein
MYTIVAVHIEPMDDCELGIQEAFMDESVDHDLVQQTMRHEQRVAPIDENASGSAFNVSSIDDYIRETRSSQGFRPALDTIGNHKENL